MFAIIRLQSVKAVVVDSVLGLHLPLCQIFISDISGTYHYAPISVLDTAASVPNERDADLNAELQQWTSKLPASQRYSTRNLIGGSATDNISDTMPTHNSRLARTITVDEIHFPGNKSSNSAQASNGKVKAYLQGLLWGDYFNSMLKCWEPLFEPFSGALLHEQVRGVPMCALRIYIVVVCAVVTVW